MFHESNDCSCLSRIIHSYLSLFPSNLNCVTHPHLFYYCLLLNVSVRLPQGGIEWHWSPTSTMVFSFLSSTLSHVKLRERYIILPASRDMAFSTCKAQAPPNYLHDWLVPLSLNDFGVIKDVEIQITVLHCNATKSTIVHGLNIEMRKTTKASCLKKAFTSELSRHLINTSVITEILHESSFSGYCDYSHHSHGGTEIEWLHKLLKSNVDIVMFLKQFEMVSNLSLSKSDNHFTCFFPQWSLKPPVAHHNDGHMSASTYMMFRHWTEIKIRWKKECTVNGCLIF